MTSPETTDCHVLVIGAGGAGVRAAIEASRYGETVLLSKAIAGKGGCTPMAEGGYNAVLRAQDSIEAHLRETLESGAFLNDPTLARALVHNAPERLRDLLRRGAVFDVTKEGEVAQRYFGGQKFPRTCYAGDRTGHEIMTTLMEWLRTTPVRVFHETSAIALLKSGDAVTGALALDRSGGLLLFRADSVILAAGGGAKIYASSTNSASGTGEGYALGYEAGAELIDMEMVQFHPTGAVHPPDAKGRLITEAARGEGGILLNREGERFMERYDSVRMELAPRDVLSRAIVTEIQEGRGTANGGVYLDVSRLGPALIEERLPVMLEQCLRFGVDIRREPVEVAPAAHHVMGGLRIDPLTCQTTVEGLYACGETAGGVHGANRLGGNALAETQVFGSIAGEAAGKAKPRASSIPAKQVDRERRRLDAFRTGDANPYALLKKLHEIMREGARIFRNEAGLKKALLEIDRLSRERLRAAAPRNLADCCSVRNACTTAMLVCRAALLRGESRGAHMRTDADASQNEERSPFGHTFLSLSREGIERRDRP
ncbi:MAG: fumarate reductase (CoM/CoB) subunit TfrA [Syntrophales bacterium]